LARGANRCATETVKTVVVSNSSFRGRRVWNRRGRKVRRGVALWGGSGLAGNEFAPVVIKDSQQLLIVDVPQRPSGLVLAKKSQMSNKLPQPHIGRQIAKFG
jgi:hypothetical protein